jgi:hypothetical protein
MKLDEQQAVGNKFEEAQAALATGPDEPSRAKPKSSEMTPGPGYMIRTEFPRLSHEFIEQFREFETADVSDVLNRLYAMNGAIRNQIERQGTARYGLHRKALSRRQSDGPQGARYRQAG